MATTVETTVTTVDKGNSSGNAAISESVRTIELKNHEFVVENYSVRKGIGVGERITSDEIVVGGHRWVVDLYPQGRNEDAHNAGYVSVYISRMSETVEPVQMLHAIHFLDQSGKLEVQNIGVSTFVSKQVKFMRASSTGYDQLLSRATLESPDSPYLKHDCLKITFSVGVFSYHHRVRNHSYSTSSSTVDLKQLLKWQWMDEFVYFRVENETYCGAKSIIVARCPTLLDKHLLEGDLAAIPIPDIDPYIFKVALYFVFFDSLFKLHQEAVVDSDPLNHESFAAKLLAAADRFEIKGLKRICESTLSNKLSRDSVFCLLHLAHLCNAVELKSACLKFAARNRSVIMESDECEVLKETCPELFLDLAGFGDNYYDSIPWKNNKTVLNTALSSVSESLICVRESLASMWSSSNKKHKMKMF